MSEFEKCLKRGGLKPLRDVGADVVRRELHAARSDLEDAERLLELGMVKRATITAYYAMFHAARAAVLHAGYAEKSHYCLLVAFRDLYAATDEGRELAIGIERARVLRENADYHGDFSEDAAEASTHVARRFVRFVERVLQQNA
ncbi:HEPN domain-containing protein [Coriobacteriia bacterium Es71-Z0120]|uniref:HEPN domain-containing protein n=1 Tax=Parvivirga hydrogeniphila TaxID=2939460 RepID=UPI002260F7FB|nr:HEPN domain-containing protein [Parvivirga hydrogeniphila]MCL4078020.1 HEPN domain-containing protein [Parvivirga hydrogeniphila]